MAVNLGSGGAPSSKPTMTAEMNVTPFVDVMLVLLIIFMVAAPLATVSIPIDLPDSSSKPETRPNEPVYISMQKNGRFYVGDEGPISLDRLAGYVALRSGNNREQRIYIRGDQDLTYRDIERVMAQLQDKGYYKLALVGQETNKPQ